MNTLKKIRSAERQRVNLKMLNQNSQSNFEGGGTNNNKDEFRHKILFGKRIKILRSQSGFTQQHLAEITDLSLRYVQSIEAGKYFPSLHSLIKLKTALKCVWGDIFVP